MKIINAFVLGGVSLLALSQSAFAQDAALQAEEASTDDGIIIVSARRREEAAQDVPVVINTVTGADLEKLNIRNLTEVTTVVPGLSLTPNANGIGSSSSMRGVNHDVNVSGENGTIQYYLDDAPVASNIVLQAMYDIGQIEVLRGPQGTLRGKATPSGSITIGLRKPQLNEFGGYLNGTMTSHADMNINGAINVPIIRDKVGIRVSGLMDYNRGDRVYSINSSIKPRRETESYRASIYAEPLDFLRAGFVFQHLTSNAIGWDQMQSFGLLDPAFVPTATAPDYGTITAADRQSVSFNPRRIRQDMDYYGWNVEADLAGQTLIYVGSKTRSVFTPYTPADTTNFFPALRPAQNVRTTANGETHEIRLQNEERIAGMFDYVAGYFRQSGNSETFLTTDTILQLRLAGLGFPLGAPSLNTTSIFLPKAPGKETSFFGSVTAYLGDSTEISAGLRHIKSVNDANGLYISCSRAQFAAGTCVQSPGTENDFDLKKTIYNASVRHRLNDSLMVYAATGSSWRPPVRAIGNFSVNQTAREIANTVLDAESSTSYEVGLKSDFLDRKLRFNLTAYQQKFENYPFRAAGAGLYFVSFNSSGAAERGQFNFVSAVPVKVTGAEAEIAFNPSDNFNMATTLNYSKSKINNALVACTDALNNATGAVGSDGLADTVAPTLAQLQSAYGSERLALCTTNGSATFLPKLSGSVQGEYSLALTGGTEGFLRGLLAWRGKSSLDPTNPFDDVGAYGLLNLYAGIRAPDRMWELTFFVKNVADSTKITQRDRTSLSTSVTNVFLAPPTFSPAGTSSTNFTSRYAGVGVTPPREFGLNLRVALGSR